MKLFTLTLVLVAEILSITNINGQANASINLLTQNAGFVSLGGSVYIQVDVGNTGPVSSIGVYKIKAQVSVPSAITSIPASGHQLPGGWTIINNNGSVINLSNGTDVIPVNEVRTILIKIQGNSLGGPSTVAGNLSFSNGNPPGTAPGTLAGDNTADNSSQSTVRVFDPIPVKLISFHAKLLNCEPLLNWVTENEINSDRFEIQRNEQGSSDWITVGNKISNNISSRCEYGFIDKNIHAPNEKVFYRLKIIDKDGNYSYSNIVPLFVNCHPSSVIVYSNPVADGILKINLTNVDGYTGAVLISQSGQAIIKAKVSNGLNYFDVSGVAAGVYVLNIFGTKDAGKKIKLVIQ